MSSQEQTPPSGSVGIVATRVIQLDLPEGFRLEGGEILPAIQVAYETYGTLSPGRDNAVYVCHALTGDAHVAGVQAGDPRSTGWWDAMIGPGRGIDTRYYFVICANILGGCKGTTGPSSIHPATGKPYGSSFPAITVGDMVRVQQCLVAQLGIERLAAVVGGSFGGMQVLEWAIHFPDRVEHCICIAAAAALSAQALAFDIIGRRAILEDADWNHGDYYDQNRKPTRGLGLARKLAHVTYLSEPLLSNRFGRERRASAIPRPADLGEPGTQPFLTDFQIESYLEHQGHKFIQRFDANSYLHITRAMDEYDLAARFGSLEAAFTPVRARILIVALSGDWLFLPEQSVQMVQALIQQHKRVSYCCLEAPYGHDTFLTHVDHLSDLIRAFLPWVGDGPAARPAGTPPLARERRLGYEQVARAVPRASRVLDLGCGDGALLSLLKERRAVQATGVEIDRRQVIRGINAGHDMLLADVDRGLAMIPDDAADLVILSETLQVMQHPRFVLREILRVAPEAIIAFPNYGYGSIRLEMLWHGRMPKNRFLPFDWYDTPNIHLFTLRDFIALCRRDGIRVRSVQCVPGPHRLSRMLVRAGVCNLGAEHVVVHVARGQAPDRGVDNGTGVVAQPPPPDPAPAGQ